MHNSVENGFTAYLISNNSTVIQSFKEWIFHPGMLFGSMDKWWSDGQREKPHEGLDICFYRDKQDGLFRIKEKTKIPALYDGVVEGIVDDFLGRTIIVKYNSTGSEKNSSYFIYGHVVPLDGISINRPVKAGEIIAELGNAKKSKSGVLPHLHITIGKTLKKFPEGEMTWNIISDPDIFTLSDPVCILSSGYSVADGVK